MIEKSFICSPEDLKKIRKLTGLTQDAFAKEIGLSGASAISMIEKGRAKPSGTTWFAVKKRFGHLFDIQTKSGTTYIVPRPQPAPTAQDTGKEEENQIPKASLSEQTPISMHPNMPELDQENLEEAVFNLLKDVLRSSIEKAKAEILSFIIMWRDKIRQVEK